MSRKRSQPRQPKEPEESSLQKLNAMAPLLAVGISLLGAFGGVAFVYSAVVGKELEATKMKIVMMQSQINSFNNTNSNNLNFSGGGRGWLIRRRWRCRQQRRPRRQWRERKFRNQSAKVSLTLAQLTLRGLPLGSSTWRGSIRTSRRICWSGRCATRTWPRTTSTFGD
jgi:hypothetical protein